MASRFDTPRVSCYPGRSISREGHVGRPWLALGLAVAVLAVAVLAVVWLWSADGGDPLVNRIPHAYLPEDVCTSDPAEVILWQGAAQGPPLIQLPDGRRAWPAYYFPSQPGLIFPLIFGERGERSTVALPPSGRRPTARELEEAAPWLTPEAQALYDEFARRTRGEEPQ